MSNLFLEPFSSKKGQQSRNEPHSKIIISLVRNKNLIFNNTEMFQSHKTFRHGKRMEIYYSANLINN